MTLCARYHSLRLSLCAMLLLAMAGVARAEGLPNLAATGVPGDLKAALDAVRQAAEQDTAHSQWAATADSIAGDLEQLYVNTSEASGQSEFLASLGEALEKIDTALSDPGNVEIADLLTSLGNRLHRRVDVLSAALALIESSKPASDDDLKKDREAIAEKLVAMDDYLAGQPHADAWKSYLHLTMLQAALDSGASPQPEAVMAAAARFDPEGLPEVHQEVLSRLAFADVRGALLTLAGHLKSRDPAAAEGLQNHVGDLLAHLDAYEQGGGQEHVAAVRDLVRQLSASSNADADALAEQINAHYVGNNVRIIVAEELLLKSIEADLTDSGPVRDFILGTDVTGNQVTNSRVSVRLEPNQKAASYQVTVTGQTNSDTEGHRGNVVIYTHSTSNFVAERLFQLTDEGMSAAEVQIRVDTHNRTKGADTNFGSIPLLGGLARGMAVRGAERLRGEAEAIAESRVRDRVVPEMTREGDRRIAEFNQKYRSRVRDPLRAQGLFPDPLSTSSTRTHLFAKGELVRENEFGGHRPNLWTPSGNLAVLQFHHSALNNIAHRFGLDGKTLDKPGFGRLLAERLGDVLPKAVSETAGEPGPQEGSVTFADQDAVRIRFEDGAIQVTLRAEAFQSNLLKVPGQIITVRYRPEVDGETVRFVREGVISVRPLKEPETDQQKGQALVYALGMQAAFSNLFRDVFETPAAYTFTDEKGRERHLSIVQVKVLDGWLSLTFR